MLPRSLVRRPVAAALLGLILGACAGESSSSPTGGRAPNVLLVSLDTLRADRLGTYGYDRGTSPNLDALGLEGIVFDRLSAPSSKTASSHMSMFTGVHTGSHGIINFTTDVGRAASGELPLAAELLSDAGYETAAFTGGGMLRAELGFARGFDVFDHRGGGAQRVFDRAREWFATTARKDRPFFLLLHTYEIHDPYTPPDEWQQRFAGGYQGEMDSRRVDFDGEAEAAFEHLTEFRSIQDRFWDSFDRHRPEDVQHLSNLYDAGVAYTDHLLGELWSDLQAEGWTEDLILIVTSDHGDAFLEHDKLTHRTIHEEILHVPLIVRFPDGRAAGRRVDAQVQGVDLMPSLLDLAGLAIPDHVQGRSWLPWIQRKEGPDDGAWNWAWAELGEPGTDLSALREGQWKLIGMPSMEHPGFLFDLEQDPGEQQPSTALHRERALEMAERMEALAAENRALAQRFQSAEVRLDGSGMADLQRLGYAE
jgi:arylsulfatase